jgi:putative transposase
MPKVARLVVPGIPHHVIQRGNRRQDVFFTEDDYRMYLAMLRDAATDLSYSVNAYCLMRNHVHLVITPHTALGLRNLGKAHQRYTLYINKKMQWRGYLWQGRFSSYPMDEAYSFEAVRYVELNPVRAGICAHPAHYRWSSARQRIGKGNAHDYPVATLPTSQFTVEDWQEYWQESLSRQALIEAFMTNESLQRPLGNISAEMA